MTTEQAFDALRTMELSDGEVHAVLARHARQAGTRRRRLAAPALALGAAAVVAVAVPATRAEIADALRAALHGGALPGKTVPDHELPASLREVPYAKDGRPRVLAEADGEQMLVYRLESGTLCFDFGDVGVCPDGEGAFFAESPVALFGPTGPDAAGRFRLWGLTLATIAKVEVEFADGHTVRVRTDGAFGVALDDASEPITLRAFDAGARIVATLDLGERWRHRPAL